ncbi:MAG: hypothetical protein H6945_12560 [Zoogloeaceae bacterium]|nr:hypothetical protein [Rhodocyclaceae bacterium]MCP5236559.1 hypothetical protein [Zoogloeaceae bacterium]
MRSTQTTFVAVVAALALGACGGGSSSDDDNPAAPGAGQPPAAAAASVDGFIGYLQQITADQSETAAAVDVGAFAAPTSDTDEPTPL